MLAADKTSGIAEPFHHHLRQILRFMRDVAAGAHRIAFLMGKMRRSYALSKRAGRLHDQFSEMHDAKIGRAEMLARAVRDRALAVLHRGVLFRDALDAGIALGLLKLAVDQIV